MSENGIVHEMGWRVSRAYLSGTRLRAGDRVDVEGAPARVVATLGGGLIEVRPMRWAELAWWRLWWSGLQAGRRVTGPIRRAQRGMRVRR